MHPVGQSWVRDHPDAAERSGTAACRGCHGLDYKGTALSYSQSDRTLSAFSSTKIFWRGFQIGCYACHAGPSSDSATRNHAPKVQSTSASTISQTLVNVPLTATDADANPLTLRIVSQPAHGTVALAGRVATYTSDAGYEGTDFFTYAAWDGKTNSNLGTASIAVSANTCALQCSASAPTMAHEGTPITFQAAAAPSNCPGAPAFAWSFGDGQSGASATMTHAYATSGTYAWAVTVSVAGLTCSGNGTVTVAGLPPTVTAIRKLTAPFRLAIQGGNFHAGMTVEIAGAPYANFVQSGTTKVTLKGGAALRALFPANTEVQIRLVNPDDGKQVVLLYNVTTNAWRTIP